MHEYCIVDKNRILVFLIGILALVAVGFVLKAAQSVILPLIIAWLISYMLGPVINFFTRLRIPSSVSVTIVLVLVLGICYLAAVFLYARVRAFAEEYPKYETKLTQLMETHSSRLARFMKIEEDGRGNVDWQEELNWQKKVGALLYGLTGSFVSFVSSLILVIIFLVFMLLGKPYFKYKVKKAFNHERAEKLSEILGTISVQIGQYISVQFLVSLVTGILVWAVLRLIGVDFAVTWGALAFFLNFIPTLGSIVASIPPILLAIVQFYPNYWRAVITAFCLLTIQMVMGNGVAPKAMGDKLNLSPVVVLLSLVFWGWLWGVAGAILSVPIACTIKIVCANIDTLRPISVMMSSGKTYKHEFV